MGVPKLLISEAKKNRAWIGKVAMSYAKMINATSDEVDKECWRWYHNIFDEAQFDYLTKDGDNEYPAKMKHIPIQRHFLDLLISQQARRPFMFSTYLADKDSLKKKHKNKLMEIVKEYDVRIKQKHFNSLATVESIEQQMQRIQQQLGKQPESEEELQQQEKLRQALPGIRSQLNYITDVVKTEDVLTKKNIKKIEQYYRYNYKDFEEELAQKITLKGRKELAMEYKSTQNFISKVVTGKEYYFVDWEEGMDFPTYETLKGSRVYYPSVENLDYVEEGPWVIIDELWSFQQISDEYGAEIIKHYGKDVYEKIGEGHHIDSENAVFVSTPDNGAIHMPGFNLESATSITGIIDDSQNIRVQRVYFKAPREVNIKESPNKYTGGKFTNLSNPNKELINKDEYRFDKKTNEYIHKKINKAYKKDDVEIYSEKNGEEIIRKYTSDLFFAVIIAGEYIVNAKKKKVLRSVDKHSKIFLPVFGRAFNGITDRPYSLIWATRGLQKLYNIVYWHKELMMALSGTKGQVMDLAQKPKGMDEQEWEYHRKLGKIYIETVDSTGRQKGTGYNQWKDFDNSLSPSIQYLSNLLLDIRETMGSILGIPKQRQGEVVASDQVGTFEGSIQQSSLITEIIYEDHDNIEGRSLSHWVNLFARFCLDKHDVLDIDDGLYGDTVFEIPKGSLKDVDLKVVMQNNTSEERNLKDLKGMFFKYADSTSQPFEHLVSVYEESSVKALKKKLEYFGELAQEAQQNAAANAGQAEMEKDTNKIKLEQEYNSMVEKAKLDVRNLELELEKAKLGVEKELKIAELGLKKEKQDGDYNLGLLELANEQVSETAVLEENRRSSMIDEQLRAVQTALTALQLKMQGNKDEKDHVANMEKIKVEDKKANKMVREHISDK